MISVFLGWYLKITLSYLKSAPSKFSNCKILPENKKCLNFGPNTLYLSIFRLQFENNIVIFEISTLQFVYFENFVKKWKCLNFGTKNALFWHFWTGIWKCFCLIKNHPQFFLSAKFCTKMKILISRTKNALFLCLHLLINECKPNSS